VSLSHTQFHFILHFYLASSVCFMLRYVIVEFSLISGASGTVDNDWRKTMDIGSPRRHKCGFCKLLTQAAGARYCRLSQW